MLRIALAVAAVTIGVSGAHAQPDKTEAAPSSIVVLFDLGSAKIRSKDVVNIDRASRAYNEGKPLVMIISGSADRSGNPRSNLALSQRRATAVLRALLDRGIPAERFQVLAKGESEPAVQSPAENAALENRRVVITWR